ncbi:MAG: nitroreductase family protein [Chloroflexi bacterium]|nr:nitroreductase family protein [Chloroflexota bacterium]
MTQTIGRSPSLEAAGVDPMFLKRWSTRAFSPEPLSQTEIDTLFEAARWAPSSSNSQPWLFLYATVGPEREIFNSLLRPGNQTWATAAPLLVFIAARKAGAEGRVLRTGQFDTGAAWMSIAIQAHKMGLYTHAMGGINIDDVHDTLSLPRDEFDVIAGLAIGRLGEASTLPEDLQAREKPNDRKPLAEVAKLWKAS